MSFLCVFVSQAFRAKVRGGNISFMCIVAAQSLFFFTVQSILTASVSKKEKTNKHIFCNKQQTHVSPTWINYVSIIVLTVGLNYNHYYLMQIKWMFTIKECVQYLLSVGMFPLQSNNIDYYVVSGRHQERKTVKVECVCLLCQMDGMNGYGSKVKPDSDVEFPCFFFV